MPKASRVRYSGTAPFADDTQLNRVQAMGSSSNLTTEDMKELGSLNIVEIVDDVPSVDISIDTNETGTNEMLGVMSNKGFGCNVVAMPTGNNIGQAKIKVRSGSYYANGNRILFPGVELPVTASGNQVVYLLPEVTGVKAAIATTLPAGAQKIADINAGAGFVVNQANITDTRTFKTIVEQDFELAKVDIYAPVKQSGSGANVARTMYIERAYANNVTFGFQVSGVASANYGLESDNKRWFLNNAAQIVVDEFKAVSATAVTISQTPFLLANGAYFLKVTRNGVDLEPSQYTFVAGTKALTIPGTVTGDLIKVRYTSATGGKFFSPVPALEEPHPELAGGLKQGQIELYLVDKNGVVDPTRTARVQSANITMPLAREQLNELGSSYPYERPLTLPLNITVSLELKDSDLELMARFAGYDNLATVNEISLDDLVKNKGLLIKIFRETDVRRAKLPVGHPDKLAIKQLYIKNLIPQSESWSVNTDSDATQGFEFLAHNLTFTDEIKA